jgi:acetyl esterase/lipase
MPEIVPRFPPVRPGIRVPYGSGPQQFGDLRLPETGAPRGTAIVIHGGFWRAVYDLEHLGHFCLALTEAGIATWSVEYRRIGNPGGGWPGTFLDIGAAADHLRNIVGAHGLDLSRVVAVGHSAGGHLALWLGARSRLPADSAVSTHDPMPLSGIVSLAGVSDLRRAFKLRLSNAVVADLLGGSPDMVPERYRDASPIERLPLGTSQRLIHGTLDRTVPFDLSKDYVSAAKALGDNAELISLEGAHHFELIDPRTKEFEIVRRTTLELLS